MNEFCYVMLVSLGILLGLVVMAGLVIANIALGRCCFRLIRHWFVQTETYRYLVEHGGIEPPEGWVKTTAAKREKDIAYWKGKVYYVVPDYLGDSCGMLINAADLDKCKMGQLDEKEVESYIIREG